MGNKKYPVNAPCPCGSGKKYKKCCGNPAQDGKHPILREPSLNDPEAVAYSDETGNSGTELFDSQQPVFWTGTLVTPVDMQSAAAKVHAECLKITGQDELHGNALGLGRIDAIADKLVQLFSDTSTVFFFTRVEKLHLAATKFADHVLDSGTNQAMSLLQYGPKASRIPLALQLIQLLDESDCRDFWRAFERNDGPAFAAVMRRALERLQYLHAEGVYHDRNVQLLGDALRWGIRHPVLLLEGGLHPGDSPNVVAFTQLLGLFHKFHERTGARVRRFIHDEQNQFAKHLTTSYRLLKRFALDDSNISAPLPQVKRALTFGCELQVAKSEGCIGLQLVDVALWLTKRFVDTDGAVHGRARELAVFIIKNAMAASLTRRQMIEDANDLVETLMSMPLSEEQENSARKRLEEIEANRIARMNAPVESE